MPMSFGPGWSDVTVVIPCHNAGAGLGRALDSVRHQGLLPAEIIVVDDASTDASADVAERHGARVERHDHQCGAAAARNTGLRASRTPLVALLDADDTWEPGHLATMRAAVESAPDAVLWLSGSTRVTATGEFAGVARVADAPRDVDALAILAQDVSPTTSGAVVARNAALALSGFDEAPDFLPCSCEDFDLWLRLAAAGRVRALDSVTVRYLVSDARRSQARLEANERARLHSVERALGREPVAAEAERQVWAATYADLGRWHLKHGTRRDARQRLRHAIAYAPRRPEPWAWLAVAMLPTAVVDAARRGARRARRRGAGTHNGASSSPPMAV